jgi:hypothetical protein
MMEDNTAYTAGSLDDASYAVDALHVCWLALGNREVLIDGDILSSVRSALYDATVRLEIAVRAAAEEARRLRDGGAA